MANTKAQFNVKEAKQFRAIMAKYDDARLNISVEIAKRDDSVTSYKGMIVTDEDRILKLDAVKDAVKIADIRKEIEDFQTRIDTANEELKEYKKVESERLADAMALISDSMYTAYTEFTVNPEDVDLREKLRDEVRAFFTNNGAVSGDVTIDALMETAMGNSNNGYRGKKGEYKTGVCVKAVGKDTFKKTFLRNLTNIMKKANALPAQKYTYIPVKMRETK